MRKANEQTNNRLFSYFVINTYTLLYFVSLQNEGQLKDKFDMGSGSSVRMCNSVPALHAVSHCAKDDHDAAAVSNTGEKII